MAVNGFALAGLGAGAIFLYTSIRGKSILATTQAIIQGKTPTTVPATNTINTTFATDLAATMGGLNGSNNSGTVTPATGGKSAPIANATVAQYQAYAFSLFGQYGWGTDQQQYLIELWNRESGWNVHAQYPGQVTSDPMATGQAYGIPQALPPDKMASAGSDWINNYQTQIRWGLGYIQSVYGNPQGAWNHETSNGWY